MALSFTLPFSLPFGAAWRARTAGAAPPPQGERILGVQRRRSGAWRSAYAGAAQDRLTASWVAPERSANEELRADLDRLRARSRDLAKNNDYARKFLRLVARNVVGHSGFTLQARVQDGPGKPDSGANAAIERAWWRWCRRGRCDVTGTMGFADLCRASVTSVARDGEALVRLVRGPDAGNSEGLALQLIDAGRLDTARHQLAAQGRNAITLGIETNAYGRPLAYWIKPSVDASTSAAVRVPASELLHIFLPEMPEQARGLPWMHAAMGAMRDHGEFNKSALLAARKGADTLGFIVSPNGQPPDSMVDGEGEGLGVNISAPGTFDVLPEGYDLRPYESQYPNQMYDSFSKAILRRIASGLDVAYNGLANDLEGVNFSSIRAGLIEERDQWTALQNWFIEALLEPVYEAWFDLALTAGVIVGAAGAPLPPSKREKFSAHEWQGRRWSWVDPKKDIEAARLEVMSGIASPQMIAARNGVDVEDVLASTAAFEAMVAAAGVRTVNYAGVDGAAGAARQASGEGAAGGAG